ncbi:hypothetical protein FRC08_007925, partial [Ceratobasidium sp. 394]
YPLGAGEGYVCHGECSSASGFGGTCTARAEWNIRPHLKQTNITLTSILIPRLIRNLLAAQRLSTNLPVDSFEMGDSPGPSSDFVPRENTGKSVDPLNGS